MGPDLEAYRTVAGAATAEVEAKGSRFLGHAAPAPSVEEAQAFVARVRAEHAQATHNVPAYRVRAKPVREWSSDDGEPGGSAGRPVLHFLQQQGLLDVVVVVTRYYGGTKLGVGGLVRAYTHAAKDAVEAAGVVERVPEVRLAIEAAYDDLGAVRAVLESAGAAYEVAYGERLRFDARVPEADAEDLADRVRSATRGRARLR